MIPRRTLLLSLAAAPALVSCGLPLARPRLGEDPTHAADPATLRQGGVFRWPVDEFPLNYNDNQADRTGYTRDIISACLPTPYFAKPSGELVLRTEYFTAVELVSTNPQTLLYTINPKAHWSDGTPLNWEDLYWQWQAMNGTNPDYEAYSTTGYRDIAAIEPGADERQAVVAFVRPYGDWRKLFGLLYPKPTNRDPEAFSKSWILGRGGVRSASAAGGRGTAPVTAGPFKIGSYDEGQRRITVVADPDWWGRKPRLDAIIYIYLPKEAHIGALQNGEVDYANLLASAPALAVAESTPGVEIRPGPSSTVSNLTFNGKPGSLLADLGLRRAVAQGIDREKITNTLTGSVTANPAAAYNLVFLQGASGYEEHRAELPYDPQAAKAALDRLGHRNLKVHFVFPAQNPASTDVGKILQQMLAEIGVDLVLDAVSASSFLRDYVRPGNFDLTTFRWERTAYPTDIGAIYGLYRKSDGSVDPQDNSGQIGSGRLNDLIAQMQAELDPLRMREIANETDREIARIAHSIPLFATPYNLAVRAGVRNFGATGIGDVDYTAIGYVG